VLQGPKYIFGHNQVFLREKVFKSVCMHKIDIISYLYLHTHTSVISVYV